MLSMVEGCVVSMVGVPGVESTGMGVDADVERRHEHVHAGMYVFVRD